ncbi:hypothetical protein [Brachybacterium sp. ACRRE]|uniref:hypothetical protein n=1 Tax=Brachybacterium sp. ACRRE TaxID=2918184 RepID=UPI001EF2A3E0|nr:hypothetical protein [Brachybacterium sp. ACRRE]MCG7311357.1 hypothetical protein [Brachybacterium sp. ACRRE]
MGDFLDRFARLEHAEQNPPSQPFLPITERRYTDTASVAALAHQDATNAQLLSEHIGALLAAKHDNQRGAIKAVFAHPGTDTTLPRGIVVFHQITNPIGMTTIYSAEKDTWSFTHHMALETGDVVHYDHARSATLEAHWLGNLGKTTRTAVGLNNGAPETVLRLELAPSRGLFFGEVKRPGFRSESHEGESEYAQEVQPRAP